MIDPAAARNSGPTAATPFRVAAVVVTFHPDVLQVNRLIEVLSRECRTVYVMDNGGGRKAVRIPSDPVDAVHIVDMCGNKGLGEALNHGFRLASTAGFGYVATFDQDSEPARGQIGNLIAAMEDLISTGIAVAAVGPRTIDLRHPQRIDNPFMRRRAGWPVALRCAAGCNRIEVDYLITSGAVISTAAFVRVGQYDPSFFVDYTDMEWCFRALHLGYRFFGICSVIMPHELGTGTNTRTLGMTILGYGPIRRYYYARNVLLICRCPHVAVGWKMRLLAGLIGRGLLIPVAAKFSKGWATHWLMLIRGIVDGAKGRGGAFPGSP